MSRLINGKDIIHNLVEQEVVPKNTVRVVIDAHFNKDTMIYYEIYNGKIFCRRELRDTTKPSGCSFLDQLHFEELVSEMCQRCIIYVPIDNKVIFYSQDVAGENLENVTLGELSKPEEVIGSQPRLNVNMNSFVDSSNNSVNASVLANEIIQYLSRRR